MQTRCGATVPEEEEEEEEEEEDEEAEEGSFRGNAVNEEEEEEEAEESLFKADTVNEEDPERDRTALSPSLPLSLSTALWSLESVLSALPLSRSPPLPLSPALSLSLAPSPSLPHSLTPLTPSLPLVLSPSRPVSLSSCLPLALLIRCRGRWFAVLPLRPKTLNRLYSNTKKLCRQRGKCPCHAREIVREKFLNEPETKP